MNDGGHIEQNITVAEDASGTVYGVIGADVHIFGDHVPVYLLTQHRPAPVPDPEFLRELPSRMLNARYEVVPFTGRDTELADLRAWRDSGPRLAARWLHGTGGQGKTRLANQFADECTAAGWKVVIATHGPGTVLAPQRTTQDLRLTDAAGVLLIVDYADRWPLTHLTWLFTNRLLHQVKPTRILMLARTNDVWPTVRATLANHEASTSGQRLAPLDHGRGPMFTTARHSFAGRYGIADPGTIEPATPLDDPDMGLMLAVHMAALVAVDARANGAASGAGAPGRGMEAMTIYLLDREHLHWQQLYRDGTHQLDPTDQIYRTPPELMDRAVFAASLTGPHDHDGARRVVTQLAIDDPHQTIADHLICYPPPGSVPEPGSALEPLYPDRLAEDYVALTLPGHQADYPAQAWAEAGLRALSDDAWAVRLLTLVVAAAERWPHVRQEHLFALVRARPAYAIAGGGSVLAALVRLPDVDIAVLKALEPLLPSDTDFELAASITITKVAEHQLGTDLSPADRARSLANLAGVRAAMGLVDDAAVVAAAEAVEIRRGLGDDRELVGALDTFQAVLLAAGRGEEASKVAREAVAVGRVPDPTDDQRSALARSLRNLGATLNAVGHREEAVGASEEALAILRQLAQRDPEIYGERIEKMLTALAHQLSVVGRRAEALAVSTEAVAGARAPGGRPNLHLATALANHGLRLGEAGLAHEALAFDVEVTSLFRRLADTDPDKNLGDLASSLDNQALHRAAIGQTAEALALTSEAVGLFRKLVAIRPATYSHHLAAALDNLALRLAELGREDEALAATEESVAVFGPLAAVSPAQVNPDYALALFNLSNRYAAAGRSEEAVEAVRQAVELNRDLVSINPAAHRPGLAATLLHLGQALELFVSLAQDVPRRYLRDLVNAMDSVGTSLQILGRWSDLLVLQPRFVTLG